MLHKLKMLGVVLAAVLAMGAVVASAASANITEFTSVAGAKTETTKDGLQKFTITGQGVSCEIAEYSEGEVPSEVFTELTIAPTYSSCKMEPLGVSVTITGFGAGGCDFVLHASGSTDLACAAGKEVVIDAGPCTVHIPAQNGLDKTIYTTVKTLQVEALTVHVEAGNMKATHTDGFLCPFTGSGTSTSGGLDFTTEIWATDANKKKVVLTDHTIK